MLWVALTPRLFKLLATALRLGVLLAFFLPRNPVTLSVLVPQSLINDHVQTPRIRAKVPAARPGDLESLRLLQRLFLPLVELAGPYFVGRSDVYLSTQRFWGGGEPWRSQ